MCLQEAHASGLAKLRELSLEKDSCVLERNQLKESEAAHTRHLALLERATTSVRAALTEMGEMIDVACGHLNSAENAAASVGVHSPAAAVFSESDAISAACAGLKQSICKLCSLIMPVHGSISSFDNTLHAVQVRDELTLKVRIMSINDMQSI